MSTASTQACAACKYQRRKCSAECPLAPYFPPDQPKQFLNVHRLFGVSNVLRILRQVDPAMKGDTMKSIVYEADAWERDPVHGCLGLITFLQTQVENLRSQLDHTRSQIFLLEHNKHIFNPHQHHLHSIVNPASIGINPSVNDTQTALGDAWIYPNYGQPSEYRHEQLGLEASTLFTTANHDAAGHNYDAIEHNNDMKVEFDAARSTPYMHEARDDYGSSSADSSLPSAPPPSSNLQVIDLPQEDLKSAAALFSLTSHE